MQKFSRSWIANLIGYLSIFTLLLVISLEASQAEEISEPLIIPRASWGANSLYNSLYDNYWVNILQKRKEYAAAHPRSEASRKKSAEKQARINSYIANGYADQFDIQETIKTYPDGVKKYAWPLKYMDKVDAIVVHHTASEYDDSFSGIQNIHKFHSLSRTWGDIGYNYII